MNALDRARALARIYRTELAKRDPIRAAALDQSAQSLGETWIVDPTTAPIACTVPEAAALIGVTAGRVRQLIAAGELPTAGSTGEGRGRGHVLFVRDVLAYRARRVVAERGASGLSSSASG